MKWLLLTFLMTWLGPCAAAYDVEKEDQELSGKILKVLAACDHLKVGSTREELEKVFTLEAGAQQPGVGGRYIYRTCPYIKVDVVWNALDPSRRSPSAKDTIRSISKLYLGCLILD